MAQDNLMKFLPKIGFKVVNIKKILNIKKVKLAGKYLEKSLYLKSIRSGTIQKNTIYA